MLVVGSEVLTDNDRLYYFAHFDYMVMGGWFGCAVEFLSVVLQGLCY